jgi:lambda family phage portal protein
LLVTDYWTLRARSAQLFKRNLYARGLIRRLVTNVINTGLHLEATPEEGLLGLAEDSLVDWAENVENRFEVWGNDPTLCDQAERMSFGELQAAAYREALIEGDVLVMLTQDRRTGLPRVRLVSGSAVLQPMEVPKSGNTIKHGVEVDSAGRHVAYWVRQEDNTLQRLPAWGEKSKRRLAWMVYGTDKRLDDIRGEPILSLVLQSLQEIDRYRDSVQRKAVINAIIAMFIRKTEDKPGSRGFSKGALRRGVDTAPDTTGTPRNFRITEQVPGVVIEELQQGEEPQGFQSNGTDEKFGDFEAAIIQAVAWAHEIPPEILTLSFTRNYSASQAAINEFKLFLLPERTRWGKQLCQPLYEDWLLSEVIAERIDAKGLYEAWRNPADFIVLGAWSSAEWSGHVKPAVDLSKLIGGYEKAILQGLITRDRAARELFGSKYTKNVRKLRTENQLLLDTNRPLMELEALSKPQPSRPEAPKQVDNLNDEDDEDDNDNEDEDAVETIGEVVHMRRA